ncbi:MAG: serpin family protein [Gemmatimonadota bacterium]
MRVKPFTIASAAVLALGLGVVGCKGPTEPGRRIAELPRELSGDEASVVSASNAFGFRLLAHVASAQPDSNVFLSPLSASMALAMTLNGAAAETFDSMRSVLALDDVPLDAINASYRELIPLLRDLDPRVRFGIGNSIWVREAFEIEQAFLARTRESYDAEVSGLDFDDPASADVINAWVAEATNGRITGIVEAPIDPLTMAFLINAIYFKGTWTFRFDPAQTRDAPFTRPGGSAVTVPLMHLKAVLPYAATPNAQIVDLPYAGAAFSMTVVLPRPGVELDPLAASLDAARWEALLAGLDSVEIDVALPRFRIEYETVLNEPLSALGMGVAFSPDIADFTPMYRHAREVGLHIEKVKQKTFVEVDEEGTEAAAATSVDVGVTSVPPSIRVDRPFLFAIRERFSSVRRPRDRPRTGVSR